MEIADDKYADLVAKEAKVPGLEQQVADLQAQLAARDKTIEEKEAEVVAERARTTAAEAERDDAKEQARVATLRDERLAKLGKAFVAKLDGMPTTKARLNEQAGTLSDEDWAARLTELSETTGVKHDDDSGPEPDPAAAAAAAVAAKGGDEAAQKAAADAARAQAEATAAAAAADPIFAPEVLARSGVGAGGSGDGGGEAPVQTAASRTSLARGLMKPRETAPAGGEK